MLRVGTTTEVISTGIKEISEELDGGIRAGSLVFIEGETETGKSVLTQHITFGALGSAENAVAFYCTGNSIKGLIEQMESLSLHVQHHFLVNRLRIYPLTVRSCYGETQKYLLNILMEHLQNLPESCNLVIVDSVTQLLTHAKLLPVLDFFQGCRDLCKQGRSIVLVANSHAFEKETISRVRALSDDYLELSTAEKMIGDEQMDERVIKILEVTKLHGAERPSRDSIRFEIRPETGIQILPFTRVRV
ncbi:ATPase domain-containing protein [Chloroflexota bacterium]